MSSTLSKSSSYSHQGIQTPTCTSTYVTRYGRLNVTKKSLDLLVHPYERMKSERDVHEAMVLLAVLLDSYLHITSHVAASQRVEDREDITGTQIGMIEMTGDCSAGDQDEMLRALLVDMMLRKGKKVCQARLSHIARSSRTGVSADSSDNPIEEESNSF